MLQGSSCVLNQLECLHAMCWAISVGPCGIVQPITSAMMKKMAVPSTPRFSAHFSPRSHISTCCRRYKFSTLMVRNLCDRHCTVKDNSWMCILHQYHKASGLKSYPTLRSEENGVNIFH